MDTYRDQDCRFSTNNYENFYTPYDQYTYMNSHLYNTAQRYTHMMKNSPYGTSPYMNLQNMTGNLPYMQPCPHPSCVSTSHNPCPQAQLHYYDNNVAMSQLSAMNLIPPMSPLPSRNAMSDMTQFPSTTPVPQWCNITPPTSPEDYQPPDNLNTATHRKNSKCKCDKCLKDPKDTQFACNYEGCPKVYRKRAHLVYHTRQHTGERPFQCVECQKGFIRKDELKRHSLTHSDERRHMCSFCAKRFKRSDHLKKHLLLHARDGSLGIPFENATRTE